MNNPLVSIGLPVFNGEKFIGEAIESILGQTYADFELIICDNASTDHTYEICKSYKDSRIVCYPSEVNRGAAWNYNRAFQLARGTLFKWAAHDDRLAPGFLDACVAALRRHPEAVLAYTAARAIDEHGVELGPAKDSLAADAPAPIARFGRLILRNHPCLAFFGVGRTAALRRTGLHGNYNSADRVLLAHLGLLGPILRLPDPLFFWRRHPGQSIVMMKDRQAYATWFDPANRGKLIFPTSRLIGEYLGLLRRHPLSAGERSRGYAAVLLCCLLRSRGFLDDLGIAGKILMERVRT